ncbi:MAG: RagB/SusD family nutrient uptake outer membrane protein [Muribaculaceae bacterium]|nr:RagB/SusD family nutrient uptake outer membrane protein [Muribaculaceae bacterium]
MTIRYFISKWAIVPILVTFLASCESKLDIVPKGETVLDNLDDIELLLNQEYSLEDAPATDISMICGEVTGMFLSVPEVIANPNTLNAAYLTFDENIDRVMLAQNSGRYSAIYKYVNYMNTILVKVDQVEGERARKDEIKAKARIMRAYFHWLCVNIHAAQYEEDKAADLGGIAYVTDIDNLAVKQKLSLADTYKKILEDCDDAVIENLPIESSDIVQADRAFGYAVRAKVLFQMKRYEEALPYYKKALELNGSIEDRTYIKDEKEWLLQRTVPNHYVWIGYGIRVSPTTVCLSLETDAKFEKNDYVLKYCGSNGWDYSFGKMYTGLEGVRMYMGWNTCNNPYGITSDHLYYDLAECMIRTGEIREGLVMIDGVRKYRVENYTPYTLMYDMIPLDEKSAMVLLQGAKFIECIGTYENFFDQKRWNTEEAYKKTIKRDLKSFGSYTLEPESPLWILPFPASATRHNPTLTQNIPQK